MICYCCQNPYDLGCVPVCEPVSFPLFAAIEGLYYFVTEWQGTEIKIEALFAQGEQLRIRQFRRASDYVFKFNVFNPDGQLVTLDNPDNPELPFDCFKFKSIVQTNITEIDNDNYPYC